jgi:hypothetical protein
MSFSSTLRRAALLGPAAPALFVPLAASAQETVPEAGAAPPAAAGLGLE